VGLCAAEYIEWLLGCDKEVLEMRRFINAHERTGDLSSIQTEIKNALLAGHPLSEPYFRKKIVNLKTAKLVSGGFLSRNETHLKTGSTSKESAHTHR